MGRRRRALLRGLALGVAAALLWWLARNTAANLDRHGIGLGFDFLRRPANFEIGESWITYRPDDSLARAILVGLANTALVSVLGWVLAVGLGFGLGLLRLARSPALAGLVRSVVDLLRNLPLLLVLLFLAALLHGLPPPRAALEPWSGVFLSDRGLVLPAPGLQPFHWALLGLGLAALVFRRRAGQAGWLIVGLLAAGFALSLAIRPPLWDRPALTGFNFSGGITVSPELAALLLALVLHHGAHLSEVVRGAVLAVPRGQRDAAAALGLTRFQATRLVVLPEAIRAMVPLVANQCVSLTKNSSLAVAIGFPDVVSILNTTANQTGHAIETMLLMIGLYLGLSLGAAAVLERYNARILRRGAPA